jgi:hypothetical protein
MRTSTFCSLVAVSATIFAMPLVVSAQTGSQFAAPTKDIAPPPPETLPLEEGQGPSVNIRQPDTQKKITEKKSQGKVTEVKCKPARPLITRIRTIQPVAQCVAMQVATPHVRCNSRLANSANRKTSLNLNQRRHCSRIPIRSNNRDRLRKNNAHRCVIFYFPTTSLQDFSHGSFYTGQSG